MIARSRPVLLRLAGLAQDSRYPRCKGAAFFAMPPPDRIDTFLKRLTLKRLIVKQTLALRPVTDESCVGLFFVFLPLLEQMAAQDIENDAKAAPESATGVATDDGESDEEDSDEQQGFAGHPDQAASGAARSASGAPS